MGFQRDPVCEICNVLEADNDFVVLRTAFWNVVLAPDQMYLGRAYITALDHVPDLGALGPDRYMELYMVKLQYEDLVKRAFGAVHVTYAELGNHGYRTNPPHAHFHSHVRPRYRNPVVVGGETFVDIEFGNHHLRDPRLVPEEVLREIFADLQAIKHAAP